MTLARPLESDRVAAGLIDMNEDHRAIGPYRLAFIRVKVDSGLLISLEDF